MVDNPLQVEWAHFHESLKHRVDWTEITALNWEEAAGVSRVERAARVPADCLLQAEVVEEVGEAVKGLQLGAEKAKVAAQAEVSVQD